MDDLMYVSRFSSYKTSTGVEKLSSVVVVVLFKIDCVFEQNTLVFLASLTLTRELGLDCINEWEGLAWGEAKPSPLA